MPSRIFSGILLSFLLIGMLACTFKIQPVKAQSTTIIVPDDYPTIQDAINNATAGDTVLVREGHYGDVCVNKSVTLIGQGVCTVGSYGQLDVSADNVQVTNFVIGGLYPAHPAVGTLNVHANYVTVDNVTIWCKLNVNSAKYCNFTNCNNPLSIGSQGFVVANSSYNGFYHNSIVTLTMSNSIYNVFADNSFSIAQGYYFSSSLTSSNNNIFYGNIWSGPLSISGGGSNQWDMGYPSGGNYWGESAHELDLFSGPGQNISGSDGICDKPYVIDQQNIDHYPLMVESPVADFTYSPLTPIVNETVTFDASVSKNGWNGTQSIPINTYEWDFGDSNTATGQVVTHIYENPSNFTHTQNFTVTLTVTDAQGLLNVTEKQVQVGQPNGPLAAFTINPEFPYVGRDTQLNASVSLPGWNGTQDTPITLYIWDFGDGNVTSGDDSTIFHSYAYAGNFNVTLTVSDSENTSSSCSHTVLVVMPTSISVSASATSSLIGYMVSINGTLSDVYGNAIGNEPVVLYYALPAVSSLYLITSTTTGDNGQYSAQWIPTATGSFCIVAEWTGNMTYSAASSNVTMSCIATPNEYVFSVESNSTITGLEFNTTSQELSFTASGPSGTTGYAKVTIAKSLVSSITNIRVYLDNNQTEYSITSTNDSWLLIFNYTHSTHAVRVDLSTSAIPEFSNDPIPFLLVTLTVVVLVAEKRKLAKLHNQIHHLICAR